MMRRAVLVGFFILLFAGFYALAHLAPLPLLFPHGSVALAERNLMVIAFLLMLLVVVPVFVLLGWFAWHYRASNAAHAAYEPEWSHNRVDEFLWWGISAAIILALAIVTWYTTHELDPYRPLPAVSQGSHIVQPLPVEVIALDWKWLFIYPTLGVASVNDLSFPAGTPLSLSLTSDAPMNSFWIPSLGGQIYAMPGMVTKLNLMTDTVGAYAGGSANFTGDGFSRMTFTAHALTKSDFDAWVAAAKAASSTLDARAYASLAQPSQGVAPRYYSAVDARVFLGSVVKYMAPMSSSTHP